MGEWLADNWIALLALLGAGIGWLDNRRRILASEVQLEIEHDRGTWWSLRNTGTRRVFHPQIQPESVEKYSLNWNLAGLDLQPQQSTRFDLAPSSEGTLPDSVVVMYRLRVMGRTRAMHVRMPEPSGPLRDPEPDIF